jgi:hypothetical protein
MTGVRRLVLAFLLLFGLAAGAAPAVAAEPTPMRQPQVLQHRPSGFWTSNRPAENGAYRYRLLGIGVGLAGIMGFVMWRLMRRANAERATGSAAPRSARR